MVKKTPKMFFRYQGEDQSLISIDRKNKKWRGRSRYLLSVEVEIIKDGNAIPAKVVYVRNRNNRKDYLCLLSTDLSLEENEIIRLYGKRWDIEVFFKVCKKLNTDFLEKRAPVLFWITAQDADTAAVCGFGSEHAFDGCTFSCSVCAEHSEDLPLSGLNAQIIYSRFLFSVAFGSAPTLHIFLRCWGADRRALRFAPWYRLCSFLLQSRVICFSLYHNYK